MVTGCLPSPIDGDIKMKGATRKGSGCCSRGGQEGGEQVLACKRGIGALSLFPTQLPPLLLMQHCVK